MHNEQLLGNGQLAVFLILQVPHTPRLKTTAGRLKSVITSSTSSLSKLSDFAPAYNSFTVITYSIFTPQQELSSAHTNSDTSSLYVFPVVPKPLICTMSHLKACAEPLVTLFIKRISPSWSRT